jgi:hypothetical protein
LTEPALPSTRNNYVRGYRDEEPSCKSLDFARENPAADYLNSSQAQNLKSTFVSSKVETRFACRFEERVSSSLGRFLARLDPAGSPCRHPQ